MKRSVYLLILILGVLASCSGSDSDSVNKPLEFDVPYVIKIETASTISWDSKQPCKIEYIENGKSRHFSGGIKCRGGVSSKYEKHSFTVEFSANVSLAGLPADDDWILNASYIDKTFQRHKLSYDLYRKMDTKNRAAKCEYASVYVNGKFEGLYIVMEKVNGSYLGLDPNDEGALLFKDPLIFFEDKLDGVQDTTNYYQQKFPKIDEHDASGYMERLNEIIFKEDDALFNELIPKWFDLDNVVDWHLILLLTNNDDGLFKNFYLYEYSDTLAFRFAIWDYDHSFGRDGDGELNNIERPIVPEKVRLIQRLMESNEIDYKERLKARWTELRSNGTFTIASLTSMVNKNDHMLRPYLEKNTKRWPMKSKWYPDNNGYEQEIEIMKDYIEKRIPQLDLYFNKL